jgi:hypothetical protein
MFHLKSKESYKHYTSFLALRDSRSINLSFTLEVMYYGLWTPRNLDMVEVP